MSESSLSALFLQNPQLAIALRRRMEAEGQIKEGTSSEPIRSPWQGVNRLAQGLLGGYGMRKADEEMMAGMAADQQAMTEYQRAIAAALAGSAMGGGQGASAAPAPAPAAPAGPAMPPAQIDGGAPSAGNQDFVSRMMPHAMAVSQATGLDPRLVLAQSALETGFGKSAPGNNFFGIKGPGQTLATQESVNGQMVPQQASFRAYETPDQSFQDYAAFLKQNPRYAPVLGAQGLDAQIDAMGRSGYATDPQYGQKLRMIARGINLPVQEANAGTAATDAVPATVPRETPPAPMGGATAPTQPGAVPGIPTRPPAPGASALTNIYMNGLASPNPRVRAMAQGLAPFIQKETPAATVQEVPMGNGMMQKVISYDQGRTWQNMGTAYDPRGPDRDLVPIPQEDGTTLYKPRAEAANAVGARPLPSGYARTPDGKLAPIPGGPEDPNRPQPPPQGYTQRDGVLAPMPGGPADPNRPQAPPAGFQPAGAGRALEAIPGGPEDPSRKTFERANSLRDEYTKLTGDFRTIQDAHQKLTASANMQSAAGDLGVIFGIMKMYDPGSTVREGEQATAQNAGGVPDRIRAMWNRALTGERLAPNVRADFMQQADLIMTQQRRSYDNVRERFDSLAKSFGLDPKQVVIDYVNPAQAPVSPPPGQPARRDPNNPLGLTISGAR